MSTIALLLILAFSDWSGTVRRLEASAVYIDSTNGTCTGFVIHSAARAGDKDFVLTAAHCDGPSLYAAHVPAKVVFKDAKKDLMVLEVDDLARPALALAKTNPLIGDELASYGYGYGLERAMFRVAHVSDTQLYIPESGIGGPFLAIDAAFISGQSGGPVVNAQGQVVMIVQRGGDGVGIGVGAELIRESVGRYFEGK